MDRTKKQIFKYENETGDAALTVYTVYPGIQVVYNSVHMDRFDLNFPTITGNFIEIQHCMEGRIEQEIGNSFLYLMPGDLSIAKRERMVQTYNFPLRHYHGITIAIDIDVAPMCFSEYLKDVNIQPTEVVKRLCGNTDCVILRSEAYIEHIFSEIYTVSENHKLGFLKIKILELLYTLNMIEPPVHDMPLHTLPRIQVNLAKQVAAYLSQNMDKRITISEIAEHFNVSESYLKTVFKGVYGVAIFSYIRIQKMQCAAQELISTDHPIGEIAARFGYINESKFSSAFKNIMGDSPSVWRSMHSKIQII